MNIKRIVLAMIAVLLVSHHAMAKENTKPQSWTSVADLVDQCNTIEQFSAGACMGYVVAVAEITESGYLQGYRSCIPSRVTKGQLEEVVKKYIAKHADYRQYVGYQAVVLALVESFPCEKQ